VIKNLPSKKVYRVNAIPLKISMAFVDKIGKNSLKFIWNLRDLLWFEYGYASTDRLMC
jgi:hypothetical protein